jgi:ribosomal protein L3 glutamine methyltransferase
MGTAYFTEAAGALKTVRDCLRFGISRFNEAQVFFGHGSDNAYDEAAYLILHTLHLPLDQLDPFLDAALTQSEVQAILNVFAQRVEKRVPAAYLTNEAWLVGHRFYVDERVIVPRSFIAELLDDQLVPWIDDPEGVTRVLDMCTGSGCLAILAALAFPNAEVDGVDISTDALEVAKRNIADYALPERVNPIRSNLFEKLGDTKYDLIISNPPYVDAPSMAALPPEYRHEPQLALAGGESGLDITRTILKEAAAHLVPGGVLAVEIGHNRAALEEAYPDLPFTWLNVAAGDDFVFLLHREDLAESSWL